MHEYIIVHCSEEDLNALASEMGLGEAESNTPHEDEKTPSIGALADSHSLPEPHKDTVSLDNNSVAVDAVPVGSMNVDSIAADSIPLNSSEQTKSSKKRKKKAAQKT